MMACGRTATRVGRQAGAKAPALRAYGHRLAAVDEELEVLFRVKMQDGSADIEGCKHIQPGERKSSVRPASP